ncbi:expressed unknown protein [Seminavis robusta]|uniref:Uncharacterized protein n=1 Tax=Seminavis robusta TaxID=568900 RepID=A0A9N8DE68_9STRA|nr:expressed unknown protein [Seminavis robusta]|eukprot:Sro52_g031130.1 n/a (348) ;mRNA; r:106449-107658
MVLEPISTITWVDSIDETLLRDRVQKMVSLNPWLTGRFVQDAKDGVIQLGYNNDTTAPEDTSSCAELIHSVEDPALGAYGYQETKSYTKLMTLVEPYLLKPGLDLKQQQFWKLVIVKPNLLIVSMTHALGDGASYYTLFQMLITGNIEAVPIERIFGALQEEKVKLLGGEQEANLISNWGYLVCFMRGLITSNLIAPWWPRAERATARFFLVDPKVIQTIKQDAKKDDVPFVSTNDILASWFFKETNLGYATLVVNLRERLPQLPERNRMGNYQDVIFYRVPKDVATPALVRKSVQGMKRTVTHEQPIVAPCPGQIGAIVMGTPSKLQGVSVAAPFEVQEDEPFMMV